MITLAADCLVFELASGENVPFSSEMLSVEMMGETAQLFDTDFVIDATKAVFHYFKYEQGRQTVTVGEFSQTLEVVLSGFAAAAERAASSQRSEAVESDLSVLARDSAHGCELLFYPRLREELRRQAQKGPRLLRFSGLRDCVKRLAGAERWGVRCRDLEEQLVAFLRGCLSVELRSSNCSVVIE